MLRARASGFTLVELVTVLTLVGVLAVFAAPRLTDLGDWRLRAFADDLQSLLPAMQRLSMAQRRPVVATLTPTGVSVAYAAGGTLATLPCPAATSPCIAEAGTRSVTFNAAHSGRVATSTGAALPVSVGSGPSQRRFVIEVETGLIRPAP